MVPFRDGDKVKYFMVRGVCEGDRRVTRYDMVRVMGLGSIDRVSRRRLGGDVGHNAIQAESRLDKHAIEPKPASQHPTFYFSSILLRIDSVQITGLYS